MADPDFANVAEQWAFRTDLWDEQEKDCSGSPGYVSREESALNDIQGLFAQAARTGIRNDRGLIAALLGRDNVDANLLPYLRQMAVAINSPEASNADREGARDAIWEDLFDYMHANSQTVNSREFTFGAPSAGGGNTGTGTCIRLTKDEEGYDLEGWWPDVYTAKCVQDARQTGSPHTEVFEINGRTSAPDELKRSGSGLVVSVQVTSVNARDSAAYIKNPSWNLFTGTAVAGAPAVPTAITNWAGYSSLANFNNDLDVTYRTTPGDATSASIRFLTNETLSQDLVSVGKARLDLNTPYFVDVAVYRRDSCDGTLTISLGGVSRAVTMSGLSNNAWTRVRLVATPGANCWPANFNANSLTLSFVLSSRTTGSLHLDDLIFVPFTRIGAGRDARSGRGSMGTYVVFLGGVTPFVVGDTFTLTDTVGGTRGVNQYWNAVGNQGYLPHTTGGTETWADK